MEMYSYFPAIMIPFNLIGLFITLGVQRGVSLGNRYALYSTLLTLYLEKLMETVLTTAQEEGLVVDLALGANQGAGVPAPSESDGLLFDLDYYEVAVPIGGTFNGALPGWNSGPLVAASTGLVLSVVENASGGFTTTLSETSLNDITKSVDSNGNFKISFPSKQPGGVEKSRVCFLPKAFTLPRGSITSHCGSRCTTVADHDLAAKRIMGSRPLLSPRCANYYQLLGK